MREKTEKAKRIGERLVRLRGVRTRTGVAREVGIGYSSLCNYENGLRIPPDEIKERLARYYGATVESIFFAE